MLSPGKWHLQVPKGRDDNLAFRRNVLALCRQHEWARRAAFEASKQDILFFINVFAIQYNPDEFGSEVGPFVTYPFQDDALHKTVRRLYSMRKDVLWEKSRKMGASWLACLKDVWLCVFHGRKKSIMASHSEQAVDKGDDSDTLFWKVKFICDNLPGWMTRRVRKRKLGFHFDGSQSQITGQATSSNTGVSGRATSIFLDELGKNPKAHEIVGQTRDTGPRLICSTHYGTNTEFYALSRRPDLFKVVMHWTAHPKFSKGLYRSNPDLPGGYEVLDTSFVFPPQCPVCSGLTNVQVGEPSHCCEQPARVFRFVTDGRPHGGPRPGLRSPWYDQECVERANPKDVASHLDIDPSGSTWQFYDPGEIGRLKAEFGAPALWEGDVEVDPARAVVTGFTPRKDGPLKLWLRLRADRYFPARKYGIGIDPSNGTGCTPGCLSIGDAEAGEKVAEYTNAFLKPEDLGILAAALGSLCQDSSGRPALIAWESAGSVGSDLGEAILATGYRNVYRKETPRKFTGLREKTDLPGWYPSKQARGELHRAYRAALSKRTFVNHSEAALEECLDFIDLGDDIEHTGMKAADDPNKARDNHGDHVIADALCCMACQRLGLGKTPERQPEPTEPPFGSLAWRRKQREVEGAWA